MDLVPLNWSNPSNVSQMHQMLIQALKKRFTHQRKNYKSILKQ